MEIDTASLEQLHSLLSEEKKARNAAAALLVKAEAQIIRKDFELQSALRQLSRPDWSLDKGGMEERQWGERLFGDVVNNLPGIVFQVQKNDKGPFSINYVSPGLEQQLGVKMVNSDQLLPYIHHDDRV